MTKLMVRASNGLESVGEGCNPTKVLIGYKNSTLGIWEVANMRQAVKSLKKILLVGGVCVTLTGTAMVPNVVKADGATYPGYACTGYVSQNLGGGGQLYRTGVEQGGDTSYYYEIWDHWTFTGPNGALRYDHTYVQNCP